MAGTEEEWDAGPYGKVKYLKTEPFTELMISEVNDDPVDHPPHYNQTELEAIDYIRMQLGSEGFKAYCEGNMLKYNHRWKYKGGVEDLKKSAWYQNKLIEEFQDGS